MQPTIDPAAEAVAQAKGDIVRFSERVIHLSAFVPDDKLTWTPSPAARSYLRIVAHCAVTSTFFAQVITGNLPADLSSPEAFFRHLHEAETKITTRESALALVKQTTADLCNAIDTVNAENIDAARSSPFGSMPTLFWMDQSGEHLAVHIGQLAYLQTIWGDLDNHLG